MITIQIGSDLRNLEDATESWIAEHIQRRTSDGRPTCIQVSVQERGLYMHLSTPACPSGGGGGRPPNEQEMAVLRAWERMRLNTTEFTGGNVMAFLKQLRHLL